MSLRGTTLVAAVLRPLSCAITGAPGAGYWGCSPVRPSVTKGRRVRHRALCGHHSRNLQPGFRVSGRLPTTPAGPCGMQLRGLYNKTRLISTGFSVDLEGFEPSTSSMPLRRAPNCATGPPCVVHSTAHSTLKPYFCQSNWEKFPSGPGGIRTRDLFSAIEARSQLRYRPRSQQRAHCTWEQGDCQGLRKHPITCYNPRIRPPFLRSGTERCTYPFLPVAATIIIPPSANVCAGWCCCHVCGRPDPQLTFSPDAYPVRRAIFL